METKLEDNDFSPKKDESGRIWREVRCQNCHALLCHEYVRKGRLSIKCWRCRRMNVLVFRSPVKGEEGRNASESKLTKGD